MMRPRARIGRLTAGIAAAMLLGALVVLLPDHLRASEPQIAAPVSRMLPLDFKDEVAALEAVHIALSEVEDRSTYIWNSSSGRVSGTVQLTSSFKDRRGLVCRHLVLTLMSGEMSKHAEGIACREPNGAWALDG